MDTSKIAKKNKWTSVFGNNYDCDRYIENAEVYFTEVEDSITKESKIIVYNY